MSLTSFPRTALWRWITALVASAGLAWSQTPVMQSLLTTGPGANRINLVILGDGFTAEQSATFFNEARTKLNALLADAAFAPFADLINAKAIFTASAEAGTTIPAEGLSPDTYYKASFTTGASSRLVYVWDSTGLRRIYQILATYAPEYDHVMLLVNSTRYGGAGGFPAFATLHPNSFEILLHETGHSFAGLADEYVDTAIADDYVSAEFPNSTRFTTRDQLPWRAFVQDSTAIPTSGQPNQADLVGSWEGAQYRSTGHFRPLYDSKMRSLNRIWGPVNLRAFATAVHGLNLNQATVPPSIASAPTATLSADGTTYTLAVEAVGAGPFTYQWIRDGHYVVGATRATFTRAVSDTANYQVEITNTAGSTTAAEPVSQGRLINLSVRSPAGIGSETLTVGFALGGRDSGAKKPLLIRAIGPTLAEFGVTGVLADPQLTLAPLGGSALVANDNWNGSPALITAASAVGAFPILNEQSTDAVLLHALGTGPYTAQVTGGTGVALVEVYDAGDGAVPRLVNLSARSRVGLGSEALIVGFVYRGAVPARLLIRGVGPSLTAYGVQGALADPVLTVRALDTLTVTGENDDWAGTTALKAAFAAAGAFSLSSDTSRDAAIVVEIEPGSYTATVSGVQQGTGVALVEVYQLP